MTLEDQMLFEEYQKDRKRFNEDAQKAVIAAEQKFHELSFQSKGQCNVGPQHYESSR